MRLNSDQGFKGIYNSGLTIADMVHSIEKPNSYSPEQHHAIHLISRAIQDGVPLHKGRYQFVEKDYRA